MLTFFKDTHAFIGFFVDNECMITPCQRSSKFCAQNAPQANSKHIQYRTISQ